MLFQKICFGGVVKSEWPDPSISTTLPNISVGMNDGILGPINANSLGGQNIFTTSLSGQIDISAYTNMTVTTVTGDMSIRSGLKTNIKSS